MTLQEIAQDEETAARFLEWVTGPTEEEIKDAVAESMSRPPMPEEIAAMRSIDERVLAQP